MHEIEPLCPPEGYFSIAPILWTDSTKTSKYNSRSIIYYLIPGAWTSRAQKEGKKKAGLCDYTIMVVVSGWFTQA